MEPLRKCQQAKQFFEVADLTEAGERMLTPCEVYPSCDRCPMALSTGPPPTDAPCAYCHARRTSLYEIASERLKVPMVNMADFEKILERSRTSVAADELDRFTDWTASSAAARRAPPPRARPPYNRSCPPSASGLKANAGTAAAPAWHRSPPASAVTAPKRKRAAR